MDYQDTPSFYNNQDFFNQYLGCTSYYRSLQNIVKTITDLVSPKNVLEFGSALGTTTISLAAQYPTISFEGSDIRENVVEQANSLAKDLCNVRFFVSDMCQYVKNNDVSNYDLIFLLYSFHHITDPLEKKVSFLQDCYTKMKTGGYLLITETFLPEETEGLKADERITELFNLRATEGYASTYWNALSSLSEEGLNMTKAIALKSMKEESNAGDLVNKRQDEYLVKFSWLIETAKACGFNVVLAEPVNALMEKAILLKKGL